MKKLIVMLFVLPFIAISQTEANNFKIENGSLVWQKVFESDVNPNDLFTNILSKGYFKDVNRTDSTLTGIFEGIEPDYKGYGSSELSTPMYISRSFINGGVSIQVRQGRYRVVLSNLTFEQKYDDALTKQGEKTKIETFSGRKDLKRAFLKKPANILTFTFDKIFQYQETDDNW